VPTKLFKPGNPKPKGSGRVKGTPNKWNKEKRAALKELLDPDRVLREATVIAYSDLREMFDEKGNLRPIHDLPHHVAASLASVEVVRQNITAGDGTQEWVHKIKVWDKPKAIDMLMRHLALYKDQLKLGLTPETEKLVSLLASGRDKVARERRTRA